jgi:hypothetical protein
VYTFVGTRVYTYKIGNALIITLFYGAHFWFLERCAIDLILFI